MFETQKYFEWFLSGPLPSCDNIFLDLVLKATLLLNRQLPFVYSALLSRSIINSLYVIQKTENAKYSDAYKKLLYKQSHFFAADRSIFQPVRTYLALLNKIY